MELIVDFPQREDQDVGPICRKSEVSHQKEEKRVSFGDSVQEHTVDRITDHNLWFSDHHIKSTKKRMLLLLQTLIAEGVTPARYAESCVLLGHDTSNFLGLENHFSPKTKQKIDLRRRQVVAAVIEEQKRQHAAGIYDPDELARVSFAITECAQKRSFVIGLIHTDNRNELGLPMPTF